MMSQVFNVLFTGKLSPNVDPDQAAREFASVFKVDEDKARTLISAGERRVLKMDVDAPTAQRYLEVLSEIGLEARIEPDPDSTPPTLLEREVDGHLGRTLVADAAPAGSSRHAEPVSPTMAGIVPSSAPLARPASHGWSWIKQAWALFTQQWQAWLLAVALVYLVTMALGLVPVIGSLATIILGPVFAGGLMLAAQTQQRGGSVRVSAGFDAFSTRGGQLALVGGLYFFGLVLVFLIAGLAVMTAGSLSAGSLEALSASDPELMAAAMGPGLVWLMLIATLLLVPLLMAYWFAPVLVTLNGLPALDAVRMSFRGCLKNILPLIVYGLALFFILVGFSLLFVLVTAALSALAEPLAILALLLLVPLMLVFAAVVILSIYTAYRDVFHGDELVSGQVTF